MVPIGAVCALSKVYVGPIYGFPGALVLMIPAKDLIGPRLSPLPGHDGSRIPRAALGCAGHAAVAPIVTDPTPLRDHASQLGATLQPGEAAGFGFVRHPLLASSLLQQASFEPRRCQIRRQFA